MIKDYVKLSPSAYLKKDLQLKGIEALIFDCDGVLIDFRESYNRAVVKTVEYIVGKITGIRFKAKRDILKALYILRSKGGFNSDWDSTYSIILHIFSELPDKFLEKFASLNFNEVNLKSLISKEDLKLALKSLERIGEYADERGYKSVEDYLFSKKKELIKLKEFLNYPDEVGFSLISTIFNDYYYGPDLDERLKGISRFHFKRFINYEKVLVDKFTLEELYHIFKGKMALATGRSLRGTAYTLKDLMSYFNLEASVFLEDVVREKRLKGESYDNLVKPNPYPLLRVVEKLNCKGKVIYFGDSMEDLLMMRRAKEFKEDFIFVGVYSIHLNPIKQLKKFLKEGADVIVKDIKEFLEVYKKYEKG